MATPIERNDTMIPLPFPPSVATELLTKLGVEVLFEKVLTSSDTGGHGRIVIPKVHKQNTRSPLHFLKYHD